MVLEAETKNGDIETSSAAHQAGAHRVDMGSEMRLNYRVEMKLDRRSGGEGQSVLSESFRRY